jgi:hypothetical protein
MKTDIPLTHPMWDQFTKLAQAEKVIAVIGNDPIEIQSNHPMFTRLNLTVTSQTERIIPIDSYSDFDTNLLVTPKGTIAKAFFGEHSRPVILWLSAETLARMLGHDSIDDLLFRDF